MLFTDIALGRNDEILSPSDSFAQFNREVVSHRSELPHRWKELIVSFRRYYAYLSETKDDGLKLIEELYATLFESDDRKNLYQDYRTQRLRLNRDPDHLFELYYEFFPNPDEVDLSDVVEEVLRAHYTAALASYWVIRHKEHFSKKQIHPLVVKILRQSYIEFWVRPEEDDDCIADYNVSRRQENNDPLAKRAL